MNRLLLYFAPGAGLGHLNRALAVCLPLRDEYGVDARIVTNSPFAEGLAALARMPLVRVPNSDWALHAKEYAMASRPALIVTDTFPYGLRDEWRDAARPAPLVHIARRLLTPFAIDSSDFAAIFKAEPLSPVHDDALGASAIALEGPLRLRPGRIATRIPPGLERNGLTLVVHSGPPDEVQTLLAIAERPCTVISPHGGVDYYPAANLYARARHVITAAGYNSMADMLDMRDRHTAVPFARRYDDQHGRLSGFCFNGTADGAAEAARRIAALL